MAIDIIKAIGSDNSNLLIYLKPPRYLQHVTLVILYSKIMCKSMVISGSRRFQSAPDVHHQVQNNALFHVLQFSLFPPSIPG